MPIDFGRSGCPQRTAILDDVGHDSYTGESWALESGGDVIDQDRPQPRTEGEELRIGRRLMLSENHHEMLSQASTDPGHEIIGEIAEIRSAADDSEGCRYRLET